MGGDFLVVCGKLLGTAPRRLVSPGAWSAWIGGDVSSLSKNCNQCHRALPLESFHRDKYKSDGRTARCRECATRTTRRRLWSAEERAALAAQGTAPCGKCRRILPLSAFHNNRTRGKQHSCISCAQAVATSRYQEDLDGSRARSRAYSKKYAARQAARLEERWDDHLFKARAHCAVQRALKSGALVRPEQCSRCDNRHRIEAHHDDYLRPLDVLWLCARCHKARHAELKASDRWPFAAGRKPLAEPAS